MHINKMEFSLPAIIAFVSLGLATQFAEAQTASDITDLILVTGQSNVRGSQTDYDPVLDAVHPRVFAFTTTKQPGGGYSVGGTWQQADLHQAWDVDGWHPGNGSIADPGRQPYNNFALHFAKTIADSDPNRVVGIVVASAPGQGIQHWDAGGDFAGGEIFADIVQAQALAALNAQGVKTSFDGVLWHQGETDWQKEGTSDPDVIAHYLNDPSYNPATDATYYPDKLNALITRFRNSNWFDQNRPFICGETKQAVVNERLMALNNDNDPWTGCVVGTDLSTRDASSGSVGTHFDAAGLRTLGQRYGDKYIEMTDTLYSAPTTIKIMAVGDSITQGVNGSDSYRLPFTNKLTTAGCTFEMVGSQSSIAGAHEGYSGHTADQIINGLNTNAGIDSMMATETPDVVLLHIGSNDMKSAQSITDTRDEIEYIIDRIRLANQNATVLVANTIPWWGGSTTNANITADVETLGNQIESLIAGYGSLNVSLVDVRTGFTRSMMQSDLVHPNAAGDSFIADAFLDAYSDFYTCAQSPDQTAPRTFITAPGNGDSVDGNYSFSGYATDTGGSGLNNVRVAIKDTATSLWYNHGTGTFGPIGQNGIIDARLTNTGATNTVWDFSADLPAGSYSIFALAVDNAGNDAFSRLGIAEWPVKTDFSVFPDSDSDGLPDASDPFPQDPNNDIDGDNISGHIDNCPNIANPDQADDDNNSIGNACDVFTPITPTPITPPVTPPVTPPTVADFTAQLQSLSTGKCVEIINQSTNSGANADTATCDNNAAHQRLYFIPVNNSIDTYTIEFEHSGLCLAVPNGSGANGASMIQQTCATANSSQQFRVIDENGDKSRLAIYTSTAANKVIDSHAQTDDLIQWQDYGNNNQRWGALNSTTPTVPVTPPVITPQPAPDSDNDGVPDASDPFPQDPNNDIDGDNISGHIDNCPNIANPDQADDDNNSIGNACDVVTPVTPSPVTPPVTPPATPPTVADFTAQLQSLSTGKCVEIINQSTNSGANADTATCDNNAAHQRLYFIPVNNSIDIYTIEFEHSGLCLAVPNGSGANGASMIQQTCATANSSQQFRVIDENGDKSRLAIYTSTASNAVIDSHAQTDDLIQWQDYGNNNQRWGALNSTTPTVPVTPPVITPQPAPDSDNDGIPDASDPFPQDPNNDIDGDNISGHIDNCPNIANPDQADDDNNSIGNACDVITPITPTPPPATPPTVADFTAQLQSLSTGKCVEITNQSTNSGANADTAACDNNAAHQRLYFIPVNNSTDIYTIEFEHSGLCLAVPNGSGANGASMIQQTCATANSSQQFRVIDENGDKSRLAIYTSTAANKVIDSHALTDDLIQWLDYGNNNQRWATINLQ